MVPRKPAKFENPGSSEMSFAIYNRKTGNIWTKIFLQEVDRESCEWNSICQIWLKFFRTAAYFFDFGHLQEEKTGQSWTKNANFGPDLFP